MLTNRRSRAAIVAVVAVLTVALAAPIAVHAQDLVVPDEDLVPALAPVAGLSWDETSGYGAVETSRAVNAQQALLSGDLGSMQEGRLLAVVAAAPSWDATSGYGSVEGSRAAASALLAPVAGPSWDETSGYKSVEASRATIGHPAVITTAEATRSLVAHQALLSHDLGSLQEEALTAVVDAALVAAAMTWDETSGYGAVEASRAER
jgi:hypothetical protein